MKVLDLFSGIGGFSLGLEEAGMETLAFCEIGEFPQKVLNKWWSSIPIFKDIKKLNEYLEAALMSFAGASPAKIYQRLVVAPELPESVVDSGRRCYEPFAWYDQSTQSWKTWQRCFIEEWQPYLETWPKAGMTRNGIAYRLLILERPIAGKESGLLPTPVKSDATMGAIIGKDDQYYTTSSGMPRKVNKNGKDGSVGLGRLVQMWPTPKATIRGDCPSERRRHTPDLPSAVKMFPTPQTSDNRDRGNLSSGAVARRLEKGKQISLSQSVSEVSGALNPTWVEWLMGFPCGWTDLKDSAMP